MAAKEQWANRIVGYGEEKPDQLLANPYNFRVHPQEQQKALEGLLAEVGWVSPIIVNRRTGHIVDGHLRVMLALRREEPSVPVAYVDMSEAEELEIIAAYDYTTSMAKIDRDVLEELLHEVTSENSEVQKLLTQIGEDYGIVPPDFEPATDDDQGRLDKISAKKVTCPECGHEFTP